MAGGRRVYLIIYYIGRGGPTPALPGREGEGETENGKLTYPLRRFAPRPPNLEGQRKRGAGGVFMNERKPGGKNEMPRNAKTRTRRIIFCPPEHINMLSGNTRTSHPGGQGRVTREDKDESPRRTRASHQGGQGRVTREDKDESSGRTESDVKTDGIKRADVSLSSVSGKQADKHVFCIKHYLFELYEVIHTDVCLPEVNGTWHGGNIYLGKGISLPCYLKVQ